MNCLCPDGTTILYCWQTFANQTRHIRRTCTGCYLVDYAPQTQEHRALADTGGEYGEQVRPPAADTGQQSLF